MWGDWITRFNTTESLARRNDGVWSATIGPLTPGLHSYLFLVDDLSILDPANPQVALGAEGADANLIRVPGTSPRMDEPADVPHGAIHTHFVRSSLGAGHRRFIVYTPPGYEAASKQRYPMLVLLHGAGNTASSWTAIGAANWIADNLLAASRACPVIIVMPDANSPGAQDPVSAAERFERELLQDVIPFVESRYRVHKRSQSRDRRLLHGRLPGVSVRPEVA